jgi:NADPH:quinone reductase-like Zn-dependent oxidoreductase
MNAVRIHRFGGVDVLAYERVSRPELGEGQVLVRVKAAGVGPWDALIRSGGSKLGQKLPLTLGADLAGTIESSGPGVCNFQPGDEVFGATNPLFIGAYAEYAIADAVMIAPKPKGLNSVEAASVPVIAVTAQQMVADYGEVDRTKRVLVQGGAGNVGAYAIQIAKNTGAEVIATAFAKDIDYVQALGADKVIDVTTTRFEDAVSDVDVVLDTVGGQIQERSFSVLKSGGTLVSSVSPPDQERAAKHGAQGVFFYVNVTSSALNALSALFQSSRLIANVGDVLPLAEARLAHEMLAGKPHQRGKIVLSVQA